MALIPERNQNNPKKLITDLSFPQFRRQSLKRHLIFSYILRKLKHWPEKQVKLANKLHNYHIVRDIKPPNHQSTNFVFPNFFHEFSPSLQLKKNKNFSLVQNWEKTCFWPIKSLFSFSTAQSEKKWGKQNWLFGGLMSRTR